MMDDLRLMIDDLKARRNVIYRAIGKLDQDRDIVQKTLATLDQTIGALEQLNVEDKTPDKINSARTAQNIPANIPCVTLPTEILPPGPMPAPAADKGTKSPLRLQKGKRFKGVSIHKSRCGRPPHYHATCCDPKTHKTLYLGRFNDELDAAMAVAKKLGDPAEIQRISDMIEQCENNPDRMKDGEQKDEEQKTEDGRQRTKNGGRKVDADPPQSELASMGGLPPAGHVASVWVCHECGHHHLIAKPPKVCEKCFKGVIFHEIRWPKRAQRAQRKFTTKNMKGREDE